MPSLGRLKEFLAQDPGNVELACELADRYFATGDFVAGRSVLEGLPKELQQQPGVQFRMARLDLTGGDYGRAEHRLRRLLEEGHDSPAIGHDLAFCLLCQRRLEEASDVVVGTLSRHEASPELRILQARVALMKPDHAQAEQALARALELDPDNATALGLRALGWLDAGQAAAALEAATACLSRYPDQHEALLAAGTLALWRADRPAAETFFSRALARFPNSGRALSGMGQVLMLEGRLDEARPVLEHAVATMPEHIGSWHALGWLQLLQGNLEAAAQSYRSACELDRNFAESHGGLAVVALLEGRQGDGLASMTRALKLDPHCISGRYAKTLWLESQGELEQSSALFAELMGEGALPGMTGTDAGVMARALKSRMLSGRTPR